MNKEENMAIESDKTQKAREKLKKQLEIKEKKITKEGLDEKLKEIHSWIARHASYRTILKDKTYLSFR